MAARQYGFLHAEPKTWGVNRLAKLEQLGRPTGIVELEVGNHLLEALFEIGPTFADTTGERPLSASDLLPYFFAGRIDDEDMMIIPKLSHAYLAARIDGANPLAIPPIEQD